MRFVIFYLIAFFFFKHSPPPSFFVCVSPSISFERFKPLSLWWWRGKEVNELEENKGPRFLWRYFSVVDPKN